MHFRKATAADKDGILALYGSLVGTECCAWTQDYPNEEEIEKDLSREDLFCLENQEGQIVGTISIDQDREVESLPCWARRIVQTGSGTGLSESGPGQAAFAVWHGRAKAPGLQERAFSGVQDQ